VSADTPDHAGFQCARVAQARGGHHAALARRGARPVFDEEDDGSAQGGSAKSRDELVQRVQFAAPLPPQTRFTLELPKDFHDAAGRPLRNAASFPLAVATGALPPLAKFAAAPFGVIERYAEGTPARGDKDKVPALLPVTLRNVEAALRAQDLRVPQPTQGATQGQAQNRVRTLQPRSDADIIAWYRKVLRYNQFSVPRSQAQRDVRGPLPPVLDRDDAQRVQTRMLSLLDGQSGVRELELPRPAKSALRPFEVVGIPLAPGFHVVEIASSVLGGGLPGARRTLGVESENAPQRGQFLSDSPPHSGAMGQEDGKNGPLRRIRSRRFQSPAGS